MQSHSMIIINMDNIEFLNLKKEPIKNRFIDNFHCAQFKFAGIKLCFGNLVDCELLDLIRAEVGNLQESVSLFVEDSKVDKVFD